MNIKKDKLYLIITIIISITTLSVVYFLYLHPVNIKKQCYAEEQQKTEKYYLDQLNDTTLKDKIKDTIKSQIQNINSTYQKEHLSDEEISAVKNLIKEEMTNVILGYDNMQEYTWDLKQTPIEERNYYEECLNKNGIK